MPVGSQGAGRSPGVPMEAAQGGAAVLVAHVVVEAKAMALASAMLSAVLYRRSEAGSAERRPKSSATPVRQQLICCYGGRVKLTHDRIVRLPRRNRELTASPARDRRRLPRARGAVSG